VTAPLATLADAAVSYAGRPALGPLSLSVESGRITALVGPSGCGKSTALRLFAGLEAPTRGAVHRTIGRGETALVFQSATLAPWLDAAANVALPLELAGRSRTSARAEAVAALARVGLADAARLKPAQLSGGMAMRVSLARALIASPRLLLLDEPFAALDALTRRALIDDVLALWGHSSPGVLFVTHDVDEAVYLAHRVLILGPGPGRVVAEIETPGVLPRPPGFRADPAFLAAVEQVAAAAGAAP
jgi:NitT/TauT family transport system ATP-binding protein